VDPGYPTLSQIPLGYAVSMFRTSTRDWGSTSTLYLGCLPFVLYSSSYPLWPFFPYRDFHQSRRSLPFRRATARILNALAFFFAGFFPRFLKGDHAFFVRFLAILAASSFSRFVFFFLPSPKKYHGALPPYLLPTRSMCDVGTNVRLVTGFI